jgi:hypothetical protein
MKPKSAPELAIDDSDADGEDIQAAPTADASRTSGKDVADDGDEPTDVRNSPNKETSTKEGRSRRTVKKIGSQAHANFRRLKLRNKNSKGKTGGGRMSFMRRR